VIWHRGSNAKRQRRENQNTKTPRSVSTDDLKQKEQLNTLRKETTNISPAVYPIPPPTYLSTNKMENHSPKGLQAHPPRQTRQLVERGCSNRRRTLQENPGFCCHMRIKIPLFECCKRKARRYVEKNIKDDALYDRYADWSHAYPSI
jgi:hypothetical protein